MRHVRSGNNTRLKGCYLDIRAQIKNSRRESMRMSMESIVPKY